LQLTFPKGAEPLAKAFGSCRTHLVWVAAFSALVNLLYLTPTLYMMQVYDRVVPTGSLTTLWLVSGAAVLALGSLALLDWVRTRLLTRVGLRLERQLAPSLLSRLLDVRSPSAGPQALRDFENVRQAVSGQAMLALFDAPWTPIYLAACFLLHPWIGLLTLLGGGVLIGLALLNEIDSRPRIKAASQAMNEALRAQESLTHQGETLRALGMRRAAIVQQLVQRRTAAERSLQAQLTGGKYTGAIKFVRLALQSAALGMAAILAIRGEISAGAIIAASVLLSRAVAPLELLVGSWSLLVQARTSWKALIDFFVETKTYENVRTALPHPLGRLAIENVVVQLPGADRPQLRALNLQLEPGQVLGIVGPSGSGKTTLARVAAGALEPAAGVVRLDGADYASRESDDLARYIGYLPQAPGLFPGSIKDNISRFQRHAGEPADAVDARAVAAATLAGAHEMILRLPQGYDTELGPMGAGLSAGQAQRVALARAIYGDPVLLVLDEPNSNLDQEGETALMNAILASAQRGAAVIVVAHRAGVLARVDRLLVLREGVVQKEGPREEVLAWLGTDRKVIREVAR
jgi:PrtD family type I secretion system ABC transporter